PIAELLDECEGDRRYRDALDRQREVPRHPETAPSARMLDEMRANNESFFEFALRKPEEHRRDALARPLGEARAALCREAASKSLADPGAIEAADEPSSDECPARASAPALSTSSGAPICPRASASASRSVEVNASRPGTGFTVARASVRSGWNCRSATITLVLRFSQALMNFSSADSPPASSSGTPSM